MKTDLGQYLKILILRTAGVSQDGVVDLLHCGKAKVVEAELWARSTPIQTVQGVVDDRHIMRLLDRDFDVQKMYTSETKALTKLTAEDILLHYGRVPLRRQELSPDAELKKRHRDRLLKVAGACGDQLVVPSLEVIFSPDRLIRDMGRTHPGSLIWTPPGRDSSLRILPGDGVFVVSLTVERETLFPHLRAHMHSEAPEFPGLFDAWKDGLGDLLQLCRAEMDRGVRDCTAATGMDYIGDNVAAGLFPTAPAYICRRSIWEHDPGDAPTLEVLPTIDDSWKLVPADYPAWTLATGERPNLERCRQALQDIMADRAPLPVREDIRNRHHEMDRDGRILQDFLRGLTERGEIGGTCPLCPG